MNTNSTKLDVNTTGIPLIPMSDGSTICSHLPFTVNIVYYIPSSSAYVATLFTCIFNGLFCPFALLGNILVFVAVLRKLELHTVHNTSILFLAATDLLVAFIAQPAFVVYQTSKLTEHAFSCRALAVYTSTVFICTGLSIVTLILITFERYFAIFYPFKYQQLVTKTRTVLVISAVWFLWTVFMSYVRFKPGTNTSHLSMIATVLILICFVLTLFVYCRVQRLIRRVHRRTVSISVSGPESGDGSNRQNFNETKSSRTVAYLVGSLVLCLLPTVITSVVFQAKATNKNTLYHVIYPLTDTAILLNSTLNPILYVLRSKSIRSSMKDSLKC